MAIDGRYLSSNTNNSNNSSIMSSNTNMIKRYSTESMHEDTSKLLQQQIQAASKPNSVDIIDDNNSDRPSVDPEAMSFLAVGNSFIHDSSN
jgi:hypothetical protein